MKKKNYFSGLWKIVYPMILYYGITVIVQILFQIYYIKMAKLEGILDLMQVEIYVMEKLQSIQLLPLLISIVLILPFFLLLIKSDSKRQQKFTGIFKYERTTPVQYFMIAVLGIAYCLGANNLINFSRIIEVFPGFKDVEAFIYAGGVVMQLLILGLAAPIIEEVLFRGIIFRRMKEYCNPTMAIMLSGFVFGIYHFNIVQGIYATFMGIFLGYLYEKFHTLWAPILFHIAANVMSVLSVEIGFLNKWMENTFSAIFITVLSAVIMVFIIIKFHNIKQRFTVKLPASAVQSNERKSSS